MTILPRFSYIFLIFFSYSLKGQYNGFQFNSGKKIEIPFEMHQNLMVVDLVIGNKLPVKFIFDTGAEHTIICKKELASVLNLSFERTFRIVGADFKSVLTAHLVKKVQLNTVNNLAYAFADLLVLDEDYYRLDESIGQPVHGILGADLFNRYVLKIDYVGRKIMLSNTDSFKAPDNYFMFPIEVVKGKPYFYPQLALQPGVYFEIKLLIDTGAGVALLLLNNSHPKLSVPENSLKGTLAMGLGGNIEGYIGKISDLKLTENLTFPQLMTDFQDLSAYSDSSFTTLKNGIFGERLLSRFDVIIDYQRSALYLKPNRIFRKPIWEDRSGLRIIAQGRDFEQYYVNDVIPGSPAHIADIRKGDQIKSVNGIPVIFHSLESISRKMGARNGRKIQLKIVRDDRKIVKNLTLRDLIKNN